MSKSWKLYFFLLILITVTVWLAAFLYPTNNLKLIACDVGQGDAVLAISGRTQILVDGGPDNKVIDCLSRYMPFFDRKIEAVIISHPQKDHFGGIIDVIKRYKVDVLLTTPLDVSTYEWEVLKKEVRGRGIRVVNPESGTRMRLGLIYLDIVWPSAEFYALEGKPSDSFVDNYYPGEEGSAKLGILGAYTSSRDPNDFSIVAILNYKNFDALLTGDIGPVVTDDVLKTGRIRRVNYIKIPHHGSKNGLTKELLDAANTRLAVISVGKKNSFGHPHDEILKILRENDIRILRTDEMGDVVIETDGERVWLR